MESWKDRIEEAKKSLLKLHQDSTIVQDLAISMIDSVANMKGAPPWLKAASKGVKMASSAHRIYLKVANGHDSSGWGEGLRKMNNPDRIDATKVVPEMWLKTRVFEDSKFMYRNFDGSLQMFSCTLGTIPFICSFKGGGEGTLVNASIRKGDADALAKFFQKTFWDENGNQIVVMGETFCPEKDLDRSIRHTSRLSYTLSRVLPFYQKRRRSYFLVGIPGTGKSMIGRQLVHFLENCRSLRIPLSEIDKCFEESMEGTKNSTLKQVLLLAEVDFLIIEDLDHAHPYIQERVMSLLDFCVDQKISTIVTVNNFKKLKYPVQRTGRCDDKIEIGPIGADEIQEIFGEDNPSLNDIADRWPISFAMELKERIDGLALEIGSEAFRKEKEDLENRLTEMLQSMEDQK